LRKAVLLLCTFLALSVATAGAQEIPPSIAFPGSFWMTAGHVGPAERDNVLGAAGFEQGITVWEKGNWFLIPHINVSYMTDADGYDWNNRRPGRIALKMVRRIPGGIVQAGAGMMVETDAPSDQQRHGTAFVDYWAGWTGEHRAQRGIRFGAFPGHAWASSGFIAGRDPHNWITTAAVQQGVVVFRHPIVSVVPYAEAGAGFDSKRRPWENRMRYDAGVKLVRPLRGGVIEAGIAERRQHEPLSDRVDSAPVAYVNLWIGWNPRTLFHRD
jgi:hypothetical protein